MTENLDRELYTGEDPGQIFEKIAEGLQDRGFAIADHFLNEKERSDLQELASRQFGSGRFRQAGVGREGQVEEMIRGDFIRWIDPSHPHPASGVYLERIRHLVRYLNRSCFLGLRDAELHFAVYPPGKGYDRHLDVFRDTSARKLSVICYLNDDWVATDGGALRLFLPEGERLDILPRGGRLVCFLSEQFEHEVLPAARKRFSLTGWLKSEKSLSGSSLFE